METKADQIIAAIATGFAAGGKDEWDAPEFQAARDLTEAALCVWDFVGWRDAADAIRFHGRLGGVDLVRDRETFYGNDVDTFYLDSQGVAWLVASVDYLLKIERADSIPADAVTLPDAILDDSRFADAEAIEMRYNPQPA
jgi:hypothetical protein